MASAGLAVDASAARTPDQNPRTIIKDKTESAKYSLEYGEAEMELHVDAIERGEKIVLIDDLLATGGTSASAATLIRKVGGILLEAQFLIELEFLHGRRKLESTPVVSFLKY